MKFSNYAVNFCSILALISMSGLSAESKPLTVGITPLSTVVVPSRHSAPANIISLNHSTISAEITGRSIKIHVEAGETVKQGQKLVSLDCRSYELAKKQASASLKIARTQLSHAKKQLSRNQRLIKQGTIPQATFDQAEATKLTAVADIGLKKAAIETAQLAISRCQVKAPFAGQITERLVQSGQLVTAATPLFKLMQIDKKEILTNLSPAQIATIDKTTQLKFVAGNLHLKTQIRSVIQKIDEISRTQEVRLLLTNDTKLATGLSGRIEWSSKDLLVPTEFILRRNGTLGVMVASDIVEGSGKAKFHTLINAEEGQPAIIKLPGNTLIISKNQYRVKDGQTVQIQK